MNLRLNLYKRVSSAESIEEIEKMEKETRDRYGPLPGSVKNLLHYGIINFLVKKIKIKSVDRIGKKLVLKFFPSSPVDLHRMTGLIKQHSGSITPQGVVTLKLSSEGEEDIMGETIFILNELSGI
jgi:transcription-repair coupling factor (superfamily II helicase)